MKIGILIFGHLRTFEQASAHTVKNLLGKYDCDVFMHTWDEMDSSTLSWDNRAKHHKGFTQDTIEQIKRIYKPKGLKIGHQELSEDRIVFSLDGQRKTSLNGMNFMFKSLNEANEARKEYERETGTAYDIVLCVRPDIAVYNFLDIEKILFEAKVLNLDVSKSRFTVSARGHGILKVLSSQVNDMLFFARGEVIDKYIQANLELTYEYASAHMIAVTTIFTSREIAAGIMPVPVNFLFPRDWKNIKVDTSNELRTMRRVVAKHLPVPLKRLIKKVLHRRNQ